MRNKTTVHAPAGTQASEIARLALNGRLVTGLTHEIGNPLTSIINALFLIKSELAGSGESTSRYLPLVQEEVERIAHMIEVTRRVAAKSPPNEGEQTLAGLVDDLARLLRTRMHRHEVQLVCAPESQGLHLGALGWDICSAVAPILLLGVERGAHNDRIVIDGAATQAGVRVGIDLPLHCLSCDEQAYLNGDPGGDNIWLGLTTSLLTTLDMVRACHGHVRCAAGPERMRVDIHLNEGIEQSAGEIRTEL